MPGPYYCDGTIDGQDCDCGKGRGPATIKGKCKFDARCGEKRCGSHCKCARMGWRKGWNRGRSKSVIVAAAKAVPKAKAEAKAAPVAVAPPAAPVGRQNNPESKKMLIGEWYAQMRRDIAAGSAVVLASAWYDHPEVQQELLRKLAARHREPFELTVLVDRASFDTGAPSRQQPRLRALRDKGARVFKCTGVQRNNTFHKKAVIIDRRYLYTGGANITYASDHGNGELVFRMVGKIVLDTLVDLQADEARGEHWQ